MADRWALAHFSPYLYSTAKTPSMPRMTLMYARMTNHGCESRVAMTPWKLLDKVLLADLARPSTTIENGELLGVVDMFLYRHFFYLKKGKKTLHRDKPYDFTITGL